MNQSTILKPALAVAETTNDAKGDSESRSAKKKSFKNNRASASNAGTSAETSSNSGSIVSAGTVESNDSFSADVTRCICGFQSIQKDDCNDDDGLYVQCDLCAVWQHGYCVGLNTEKDVPNHYYCEICRPGLHFTSQRGKYARQSMYKKSTKILEQESRPKKAKKRSTMNSRNMDFDQGNFQCLEKPDDEKKRDLESKRKKSAKKHENLDTREFEYDLKRNITASKPDYSMEKKLAIESDICQSTDENDSLQTSETEIKKKSVIRKRNTRKVVVVKANQEDKPELASDGMIYKEEINLESININERPSRPRLPHSSTTFEEMQRRLAAILEFTVHMQVEMEHEKKQMMSISGTMNQVSGITSSPIVTYESLSMMESLVQKILLWEDKFGKPGLSI